MRLVYFLLNFVFIMIGFSQKPTVNFSCDVKTAQVGDQLTFTVKSNVGGNVEIDFPKEFSLGSGTMSGMEQQMDYNTGEVISIYYFSQNGSFKSSGNYSFYAFVNSKRKVYKSNALTIKIEKEKQQTQNYSFDDEISRKTFNQPIFGIIKRSKTKIYEGEPLVLESKIYSRLNINMMDEYKSFEMEGGAETKEIDKSSRLLVSKTNIKGQNFLTFNYGKMLVFPSETGKTRIRPFEMSLQYDNGGIFSEEISFVSNGSVVEVIPLPSNAPKNFIGGVGFFEMTCNLKNINVKHGDVVDLEIIVTGTGNLHHTDRPIVKLPEGIVLYGDPDVKENFEFSEEGAKGNIVYTYHLQLNTSGVFDFYPTSISYFSPAKKRYIQIKSNAIHLDVLGNKVLANNTSNSSTANTIKEKNLDKPSSLVTKNKKTSNFSDSVYFWPSVISPFLLVLFAGFYFVSTNKKNNSPSTPKLNTEGLQKLISELENEMIIDQIITLTHYQIITLIFLGS